MITNLGVELISKYLLGTVPSYASYISYGCGANPGDEPNGTEKSMAFEMIRVPISSRSLLVEDGLNKICFVGEMPLQDRYKVTEIGLWSDGSDLLANQAQSRVLFSFSQNENWQKTGSPRTIKFYNENIGTENGDTITVPEEIFIMNSNNGVMNATQRAAQGARFLLRTIMMRGDAQESIFLDGQSVNLVENSPKDIIKVSYAVIPKSYAPLETWGTGPDVSITLTFKRDAAAVVEAGQPLPPGVATCTLTQNNTKEYNVASIEIGDIDTAENFSWADVRWTEIKVSVGNNPSNYYIAVDAIRLDNVTTNNPLYVMTGYQTISPMIDKAAGANAYTDFRFAVGQATGIANSFSGVLSGDVNRRLIL
jgi:hypothetical protein